MSANSAAFCQAGPGGVGASANLAFWLDANAQDFNVPVDAWEDVSGNAVPTTVNGNPIFTAGVLNGLGAVRFDGNGDEIFTNLTINAFDHDQLSVIAVYIPRIDHAGSIWGEDNGAWDRFLTDITLVDQLNSAVGAGYDPEDIAHPSTNIPTLFVTDAPTLATVVYDDALWNGTHVYIGGQLTRTFESNAADYYYAYAGNGYSNFYVGAIGSSGFQFNGDIAEVIVFQNDITLTQRIIVENYLAAKYGLALASAVDLYNEDDLGYDFDVAGIGNLNGSIQNDSRGTGIVRISNPSSLDNGEFLFWGHDNGALQATNISDVPPGVQARSNRVWRVSEVNMSSVAVDVGTVDLSFVIVNLGPVDASHLRLLIDTDNDGIFADETPITGGIALGGNEYAFNGVTALANNLRFTIGTSNASQTPLPLELRYFAGEQSNDHVILHWETIFENDLQEFEIWRANDGVDWHSIATIIASGEGKYSYVDRAPLPGRSYYQLKAKDVDNSTKVVGIVSMIRADVVSAQVFPNPFKTNLTVIVSGNEVGEFSVLNSLGTDCSKHVTFVMKRENQFELNFESLPDGLYVIKMKNAPSVHVFKQVH